MYATTESGLLCEFNERRFLSKFVSLKVGGCLWLFGLGFWVSYGLVGCGFVDFIGLVKFGFVGWV